MQIDIQAADKKVVRRKQLRQVPIIQALLEMTPAEIETEVRSRINNQADAVDVIVHLTKLVALLLQLEEERREK